MKRYDRSKYWDAVGRAIAEGGPERRGDVAGQDTPFFRYKRDAVVRLLERLSWRDRRVVEVGCGPGGNLVLVTALGARYTLGVDVSGAMAREAFVSTAQLAPRVGVVVADGTHLPVEARAADIGLTVTVLQHLDDGAATQVINEMCRVCNDEIVLCEDLSVLGFGVRTTHVLRRLKDYTAMARRANFRLESVIPLKIFASEMVSTALRGVADGLRQPDFEGPSRVRRTLERTLMPITRIADPYWPQLVGLTCMRYVRDSQGN